MPKNIVLLSDGTGNSSAKLFTTNVWRLYQALDLGDPASQVAFYGNGVGTSSFKPLAILGGIFGFGLKRNVIALYSFLCRNYHDGDRIFGFGFSRGAFTIRIVAGLVAREGLVPYGSEAQLARDARAAYRHFRQKFNTNFQIEVPLRWIRNLFYPRPVPPQYRPRIHFVGLWDTVEAYGGPIVEITRAIDYWLWPLSMPDLIMSDQIDRACHALALGQREVVDAKDAYQRSNHASRLSPEEMIVGHHLHVQLLDRTHFHGTPGLKNGTALRELYRMAISFASITM